MARPLFVVGNWKMHKTSRETTDYLEALTPKVTGCKANLYLAVPFTSIAPAVQFAKDTPFVIGGQNMNDAREGAFTGEIAALMLKEAGAVFVLLGHSERRSVFGESNAFIHRKVVRALQDDLQPILCIGETLQERERGATEGILREQLSACLEGISASEAKGLLVAYEPVWAIGTGKSATPQMAQGAHAFCRSVLVDLFGKRRANAIPILYGGSVKPENAAQFVSEGDIDGVLVGGASLDPNTFAAIVLNCSKVKK